MEVEEEQKQLALAKRRILRAAGATTGLIGDPLEFLLSVIEWGEANGFEDDASFLRRRQYEPQSSLTNKPSSKMGEQVKCQKNKKRLTASAGSAANPAPSHMMFLPRK